MPNYDWYSEIYKDFIWSKYSHGTPIIKVKKEPNLIPKKHIRFKAELLYPACKQVRVVITEQTHLRNEFGFANGTYGSASCFTHEGFCIKSLFYPCLNPFLNNSTVYLRGSLTDFDSDSILMSLEQYRRFKETVLAYNNHFSGDKEKTTDAVEAEPTKRKATNVAVQSSFVVNPEWLESFQKLQEL